MGALVATERQTAVSPHPLKIGHVYVNLFTRNNPYYHLLKYLLFLLKHPVYIHITKNALSFLLSPSFI